MKTNFFLGIKVFCHIAGKFIIALLLLIALDAAPVFGQGKAGTVTSKKKSKKCHSPVAKKYLISGQVTQTFSYCGGAAPPKEILDKLSTPIAFSDKKFYIRAGKINSVDVKVIDSVISDSNGKFLLKLPPGTYSIILEEQLNKIKEADYKKQNQRLDLKCANDWWAKPYYLLKVENDNISGLDFNFQHRCFIDSDIPCISYTGPLRP